MFSDYFDFVAYLVRKIIKVHASFIRILNPDVAVIIDGVQITAVNVPR